MIDRNLGANSLSLVMHDTPHDAPVYTAPEHRVAKITTAHIVGRGTVAGRPTVDFIFEDENGQKYVAMLTGGLVDNLAAAVRGMQQRTDEQNRSGH